MDHTGDTMQGQLLAARSPLFCDIEKLCELMHFLRAWWDAFEVALRHLDRAATVKAHDAIVDAIIAARRIARELGFDMPDYRDMDWTVSIAPGAHATTSNDL